MLFSKKLSPTNYYVRRQRYNQLVYEVLRRADGMHVALSPPLEYDNKITIIYHLGDKFT